MNTEETNTSICKMTTNSNGKLAALKIILSCIAGYEEAVTPIPRRTLVGPALNVNWRSWEDGIHARLVWNGIKAREVYIFNCPTPASTCAFNLHAAERGCGVSVHFEYRCNPPHTFFFFLHKIWKDESLETRAFPHCSFSLLFFPFHFFFQWSCSKLQLPQLLTDYIALNLQHSVFVPTEKHDLSYF